ncbi:superoxide dismutase family protein [Parasphingorhabdus pacifica]
MSHNNRIRSIRGPAERIEPRRHPNVLVAGLVVLGVALGACGEGEQQGGSRYSSNAGAHNGTLAPPGEAENAFTYNQELAPAGAGMVVNTEGNEQSTTVDLEVSGLQPNRGFAAHAHVDPCGTSGSDAGPHFQNEVDPAATPEEPSTDPAYANPENEIWLDLRTDEQGNGTSTAEVPFGITERSPSSVVIHEKMRTATEPGQAGKAGGRVACLSLSD